MFNVLIQQFCALLSAHHDKCILFTVYFSYWFNSLIIRVFLLMLLGMVYGLYAFELCVLESLLNTHQCLYHSMWCFTISHPIQEAHNLYNRCQFLIPNVQINRSYQPVISLSQHHSILCCRVLFSLTSRHYYTNILGLYNNCYSTKLKNDFYVSATNSKHFTFIQEIFL